MVVELTGAAAFLLKTALIDKDAITTGEASVEITDSPTKPSDAYISASHSVVGSGGLLVSISTGTGQSKVTHLKVYCPKQS
jgi:hypothetical protein